MDNVKRLACKRCGETILDNCVDGVCVDCCTINELHDGILYANIEKGEYLRRITSLEAELTAMTIRAEKAERKNL